MVNYAIPGQTVGTIYGSTTKDLAVAPASDKAVPFGRTLNGHFDGTQIVLDDPAALKANTRVTIIVANNGLTKTQIIAAARASQDPFSKRFRPKINGAKK